MDGPYLSDMPFRPCTSYSYPKEKIMSKRVADYEIQKGIPMPDPVYPGGQGRGVRKYPFLDMKIKDCFTYPRNECRAVSSAISKLKATHPHLTFATRTLDPTTCGCWRIKA